MFGGRWMDTFMDKLAQKLNAQEIIRANSAADAEEMDQLKSQLREYDECLAQMQQVNKELKAINHEMEKLMSETIAPEVKKLSEESVAAIEKLQQENADKLEELKTMCWCGRKATCNARYDENGIVREGEQVLLGANNNYKALCRKHYKEGLLFPPN